MNPKILDLTLTIEALRQEEKGLIIGSGHLAAYGITTHYSAVADRLSAIRIDGCTIAAQLRALGAHHDAENAENGWAILTPATLVRAMNTPSDKPSPRGGRS